MTSHYASVSKTKKIIQNRIYNYFFFTSVRYFMLYIFFYYDTSKDLVRRNSTNKKNQKGTINHYVLFYCIHLKKKTNEQLIQSRHSTKRSRPQKCLINRIKKPTEAHKIGSRKCGFFSSKKKSALKVQHQIPYNFYPAYYNI